MIYPHHLEFMEEAKKAFKSNLRFETYRNTAGNLLALRYGMDRNCIAIHEIGEEIGFFAEVMEKAPELVVGVPPRFEVTDERPFHIRRVMLTRPNEWVAAFNSKRGWYYVGFDEANMTAVKSLSDCYEVDINAVSTYHLQESELNRCIPIEDIPEEEERT